MKMFRPVLAAYCLLAGAMALNAVLPAPTASAQFPIDFGRVRARQNRQSNIWEVVNSTNTSAMVRYSVAMRGTSDWRPHKLVVPAKSTRMLGFDIKTYDFKITQVTKVGY